MGLDIRHQVLRVALSVKVNGKRRRLSLHRARPPRTCVKLSMKITVTTSRVGAYPHTQKSGLRRLTGAYPHTKISVAQSYPDPYVFGIQGAREPSVFIVNSSQASQVKSSQFDHALVDFDGGHGRVALEEMARDCTLAWAELDDTLAARRVLREAGCNLAR